MRAVFKVSVALALLTGAQSSPAANDTLYIPNSADILWAIHGTRVYFRNLDQFGSGWLGCCYNYYVDLTTDSGRAMFSAFLGKHMAGQPLKMYVTEKNESGHILMIGNWE